MRKNKVILILAFFMISASVLAQQTRPKVVATGTSQNMPNIELQFRFKNFQHKTILDIDVIEIENKTKVKETQLHKGIETHINIEPKSKPVFMLGASYMRDMVMINKHTLDRNTVMSKVIPREGEKLKYVTLSKPLDLYNEPIPLIVVYKHDNRIEKSTLEKTLRDLTYEEVIEYFSDKTSHFYLVSYKLTKTK